MADLGAAAAGDEQPSLVSSLPLLFCDGHPVSLGNMPNRSLVKFVRFMLKCALGVEESRLRAIRRPAWWPRTVPYFNLKASREVDKGHSGRLRELVRCCYHGADCEYLLRFCADLERHYLAGRISFKNNFDGTSSLYELTTNRLLVTCRNENLEYDRSSHGPLSPRRHLLPRQLSRSSSQQLAMVQPPPVDIFLCDTCSAEFTSVDAVQAHERQCGVPAEEAGPPSDTESVASEPEVQCASQTRFLSYVGLAPADGSGKEPYSSPSKRGGGASSAVRLRRGPSLLMRYQAIDVSSPLGRRLGAGSSPPAHVPPEHERYCEDSERKRLGRQPSFPVSWRRPRIGRRIVYGWSHLYCFTAAQRAERRRTIRTGLTDQARRLLQTVLPCSVRLTRVTPDEIEEACRRKPRPAPVEPVWEPPATVKGVLWRPARSLGRPGPFRPSDQAGSRPATSALIAAAMAEAATEVSGVASALKKLPEVRVSLPAIATRSRATQDLSQAYSLPPGSSITLRQVVPKSPGRAMSFSRGPVWRPALVRAGGVAVRHAPVRARGVRLPLSRGVPQRDRIKPVRTPTRSKPATGKELRDNDTVVIDLCSSSDEEGDPPPTAPPQRPPPPRIKLEAIESSPAAASTNGSDWQSKNACSHWSRSCGGLTNGASSFASLDAGRDANDGDPSQQQTAAIHGSAVVPLINDFTALATCADSGATGSKYHSAAVIERADSCDASELEPPEVSFLALVSCSWKRALIPPPYDCHHSYPHTCPRSYKNNFVADRNRTTSEYDSRKSDFEAGSATQLMRAVACHAA